MNYIGLINNFWNKYQTNPVSPGAVALFFKLLHHANIRMWQFPVCLTNEFLTADMHTSKSSFLRYRDELKSNGYISFEAKNRFLGSEYRIFVSDKKVSAAKRQIPYSDTDTVSDTASDTEFNNDSGADSGLSSYNIKTQTKKSNKYFKEKPLKNYEIYNSGRYDFDRIEQAARKIITQKLDECNNKKSL